MPVYTVNSILEARLIGLLLPLVVKHDELTQGVCASCSSFHNHNGKSSVVRVTKEVFHIVQ